MPTPVFGPRRQRPVVGCRLGGLISANVRAKTHSTPTRPKTEPFLPWRNPAATGAIGSLAPRLISPGTHSWRQQKKLQHPNRGLDSRASWLSL